MFDKALENLNKGKKEKKKFNTLPDAMVGCTYVATNSVMGMKLILKDVVVRNTPKIGDDGEMVMSKTGDVFVEPVMYISFEYQSQMYFTMTRSNLVIRQFEEIVGEKFYMRGPGTFGLDLKESEGMTFTFGVEPVTYRNGRTYDVPIVRDA